MTYCVENLQLAHIDCINTGLSDYLFILKIKILEIRTAFLQSILLFEHISLKASNQISTL